jgi:hypothetical protein
MSVFKAAAHMRDLQQRLQNILPDATIFTANVDPTDGMPTLTILTEAENENVKIYVDGNAGRVDGLGLPQQAYSPHICSIVQDSATADAAEFKSRANIVAAAAKLGMKVILTKAASAGAATTWALAQAAVTADSGAISITMPSDDINPLTMSQ